MASQNFTSIDDLVKKSNGVSTPSSFSKESEPLRKPSEPLAVVEATEHEVIDPTIASYVETRKETVKLPDEVKAAGVRSTASSQFTTTSLLTLPISDEKIEAGRKAPLNSSLRWLSELCRYFLRQSHLTLKNVHGKIVRVFVREN